MKYIILFLLITFSAHSQEKKIIKNDLYWLVYNLDLNISDKYTFFAAYDHRRLIPEKPNQNHTTFGISYKLDKEWKIGFGYTFFELFLPQTINTPVDLVPHEHRPYQRIIRSTKISENLSFSTRFQIEERFFQKIENNELTSDYNFFVRFRFKVGLTYKLLKLASDKKNFGLFIANETSIQAGEKIIYNTFDQNRFQAGIFYKINDNFKVNFGYLHWYQETNQFIDNEYLYLSRNIIVLNLFNTFDLF